MILVRESGMDEKRPNSCLLASSTNGRLLFGPLRFFESSFAVDLLMEVSCGHEGMPENHARSPIAHDFFDSCTHGGFITMNWTVLAVACVLVDALSGSFKGIGNGFVAQSANAALIARDAAVFFLAENAGHRIERRLVLLLSLFQACCHASSPHSLHLKVYQSSKRVGFVGGGLFGGSFLQIFFAHRHFSVD